jgi:lantibiotic modifying enzyme
VGLRAPLAWRRLLHAAPARKALDTARAIARDLIDIELADPSLYSGHAGLVVLFDYLNRIDRGAWDHAIAHHLKRALVRDPCRGVSLMFGTLGVSWVLHELRDWLGGADPCAAVDRLLVAHLHEPNASISHDLANGLAGMAVYARARGLDDAIAAIRARLAGAAERTPAGATWKTRPEHMRPSARRDHPAGYYSLGVLHGVAGVIAVLARAGDDLADDALAWLLAQRAGDGRLPRIVGEAPVADRAYWCSGEIGIAGAFAATASARLAPAATMLAERARCEPGNDAGLCHGVAGLAHVLNRLAQRTGSARYRALALDAIARTQARLDRRRRMMSVTAPGGPAWESWRARPFFLDGAAGVALALAAAATGVEPTWDRVLLLS